MTRIPFPLAVAALALAAALSGCATTHTDGPGIDKASAVDAKSPAAAIEGTRVVSSGAGLSQSKDPLALRAPARVMRIWIAPWEDRRGDLHAPGYLYTEIEPRRWTLDARDERMPRIRPLQIERRAVPSRNARPGRGNDAKRSPGRTKPTETGPNLLGS